MKISLLNLILLMPFSVLAQTCCHSGAEGMQAFAKDKEFLLAHAEPIPYKNPADTELQNFSFACKDGKEGLGVKKQGSMNKYLIIFHEWWGLNDYIKEQMSYWHKKLGGKVTVIAPDLYDGQVTGDRTQASALMEALTESRSQAIIEGVLNTIPEDAWVASLGWCMGGGYSLQAGISGGKKMKACVMYYGMPELNEEKLSKIRASVYAIFAGRDKWITPKMTGDFYKAMKKANREYRFEVFDAEHAFANPSNPNYDKRNAEDAEKKIMTFIKQKLGFAQ